MHRWWTKENELNTKAVTYWHRSLQKNSFSVSNNKPWCSIDSLLIFYYLLAVWQTYCVFMKESPSREQLVWKLQVTLARCGRCNILRSLYIWRRFALQPPHSWAVLSLCLLSLFFIPSESIKTKWGNELHNNLCKPSVSLQAPSYRNYLKERMRLERKMQKMVWEWREETNCKVRQLKKSLLSYSQFMWSTEYRQCQGFQRLLCVEPVMECRSGLGSVVS